jgi:uncharacterized lipoprotein YddW (UPF0748 family)
MITFLSTSFSQKDLLYEFRAVWVASVVNCDFPSSKALDAEQQKAEFIKLADMHQRNGMNALIVQVRPAGDALYPSKYEPWSEYLSGTQGVPPSPYYDPLQFMIEETHKRGMEFHAWLNPYRAVFDNKTSSIAAKHLTKTNPTWFVNYGGKKYFNPAMQVVRTHFIKIINDIIERYDVDGIHIDDYFYPYKVGNKEFPDDWFYKKFGAGFNSKADWRRSNCDSIIKQIWEAINQQPRRVKFGVSPFGVWRNIAEDSTGSNTKAGTTNYDGLYADIVLWLKKGWMDYCVPQLYWERGHRLCDYDILLDWWNKNIFGRHLYIGHGLYKIDEAGAKGWRNCNELPNQIKALRTYNTTQGSAFFSSKNFNTNPFGWNDSLQLNYYSTPAIIPPMPWIDNAKPDAPTVEEKSNGSIGITYHGTKKIKGYAVFIGTHKEDAILKKIILKDADNFSAEGLLDKAFTKIFIASISINNVLSDIVEIE